MRLRHFAVPQLARHGCLQEVGLEEEEDGEQEAEQEQDEEAENQEDFHPEQAHLQSFRGNSYVESSCPKDFASLWPSGALKDPHPEAEEIYQEQEDPHTPRIPTHPHTSSHS